MKPQWISIKIYLYDWNENNYKKAKPEEIIFWSEGWTIRETFICGGCKNKGCCIELDFGLKLPEICICGEDQIKLLTK